MIAAAGVSTASFAQTTVAEAVARVADSPELARGRLGVEVYSLDSRAVRYRRDGNKFFTGASNTKLISAGAALSLLGPDHRFHTRLYRTGPIKAGVLDGDVVIVAGGDANLSGRVQADGTLAFVDEDHSYGGMPLPGDPVAPLTKVARDIAASGVRRITGTVLVDTGIFPEGERETGSGVVLSPIMVNDNIIDVIVTAGTAGRAPTIRSSPEVPHVRFVNKLTTGRRGSELKVIQTPVILADGTREVTLRGAVPEGHEPFNKPYDVDVPSRFAADVLIAALGKAGVSVARPSRSNPIDGTAFARSYRPGTLLADIVSPPLGEDVRIILKVSQNAHAGLLPYVIGSEAKGGADAKEAGMRRIHDWLERAGLDPSGAVMGDGLGAGAHFTPDFMVRYLAFMAGQPVFPAFQAGLPVLGRDGTLAGIRTTSAAAGQVFAKTGTWTDDDLLNHGLLVESKALAGYTTGRSGERLAFAIYLGKVPLRTRNGVLADDLVGPVAGDAVGGIAAAIHLLPIGDDPGAAKP